MFPTGWILMMTAIGRLYIQIFKHIFQLYNTSIHDRTPTRGPKTNLKGHEIIKRMIKEMFWDFPPIFARFLVNSCSNNKGKKLFCWCRSRLRQQTKGREPLASAVFPLHGMAQLDSALLASGTRYVAWNCRDIIVNAWFCKLTLFTVAIDGSLAACWEPRPRWCQKTYQAP